MMHTPYTVYSLDDDPVFNELLQAVLRRFGASPQCFTKTVNFRERLRISLPTVCLIDLNLEGGIQSFRLIRELRDVYGARLPIIVVSSESDPALIAHTLEAGANDYILKPLNREIFASKLARYFLSPELLDVKLGMPATQEIGLRATLSVPVRIAKVDELGVTLQSPHLLNKGSVITLRSELFQEWSSEQRHILVTTLETWANRERTGFGAYCEFDPTDEKLASQVRAWLSQRTRT